MRRPEVGLLEDDLAESSELSAWELCTSIDHVREVLEDDDDGDEIGFGALFEHPEAVIDPSRWPDAD